MPKIEHGGQGKYTYSSLELNKFTIFLTRERVQLSYQKTYGYGVDFFPLEELEELIKTYKENLRGMR